MSPSTTLFCRFAWCATSMLLISTLFLSSSLASPVPNNDIEQTPLDLGFKPAPEPKNDPIEGLPVKLYVHAGPNCHSERTHLYYLPENVCIGPLYHPAGSFKLLSNLPEGCFIKGFDGGHCRGDEVRVNHEDRFEGPRSKGMCVNMETGFRHGSNEEEVWEGVNSLVVDCGRFGD